MKRTLLSMFVMALVVMTLCCAAYALDDTDIKGNEKFTISKTIPAVILKSTDKKQVGEKINFFDLDTAEPQVLFSGAGGRAPFRKIYEDDYKITIQLVASGSGSIDTFIIDKTNGKFVRLSGGNVAGLYGDVSFGVCE